MRVVLPVVCALSAAALAAPSFDKTLAPPRAFDGIRPGAALAAVKTPLAAFHGDDRYSDAMGRHRLVRDAGDGALYYVLVENDVIARIGVEAPAAGLEARLAKLWGTPAHVENLAHEAVASWTSDTRRVDLACRETRCRLAFHALLGAAFFGSQVAPPGELAKVAPGMTRDQVRAIAPFHAAGVVPAGYEDVRTSLDFDAAGRVRAVLVGGLPASGRALLERAWGAPAQTQRGLVWLGPAGWRAVYDEPLRTLHLSAYLPAAQLLGNGPGIAALPRPVLGATPDQLTAAYPSFHGAAIDLPPTEAAALATTVQLTFDPAAKRVTALAIPLAFEDATRRGLLLALLEAKWGAPQRRTEAGTRIFAYPVREVAIEAREHAGAIELRLRLP